jgi:peptidoglycan hydrolase CwlO-like protein
MFKKRKTNNTKVFLFIVLIAIAIFGIVKFGVFEEPNKVTGLVIETPKTSGITQDTTQSGVQQSITEDRAQEQQETAEPEVETYEWHEYKGQCSKDIKRATDDVNDVTSYRDEYQQKRDALQAEYDKKLQELQETYDPQFQDTEEEVEEANKRLKGVNEELAALQKQCAF